MFDKTQLMKGSLEGCILKIIQHHETYGYEIIEHLKNIGFNDVSEGSIYPILLRLEKQHFVYSTFKESPLGPNRKYYHITKEGENYLIAFYDTWQQIQHSIYHLFEQQ